MDPGGLGEREGGSRGRLLSRVPAKQAQVCVLFVFSYLVITGHLPCPHLLSVGVTLCLLGSRLEYLEQTWCEIHHSSDQTPCPIILSVYSE